MMPNVTKLTAQCRGFVFIAICGLVLLSFTLAQACQKFNWHGTPSFALPERDQVFLTCLLKAYDALVYPQYPYPVS